MDDSWRASGRFHRVDRELDVDGVGAPSTSPISASPTLSPEGRSRLLHQPSGPMRITDDEEVRAASLQPARLETPPSCSTDVLANTYDLWGD
jgi:hypothetical protein